MSSDQYVIDDRESKQDKWNRGLDIFIESVPNQILHYDNAPTIKGVFMN